jgi:hypothetical protein
VRLDGEDVETVDRLVLEQGLAEEEKGQMYH